MTDHYDTEDLRSLRPRIVGVVMVVAAIILAITAYCLVQDHRRRQAGCEVSAAVDASYAIGSTPAADWGIDTDAC